MEAGAARPSFFGGIDTEAGLDLAPRASDAVSRAASSSNAAVSFPTLTGVTPTAALPGDVGAAGEDDGDDVIVTRGNTPAVDAGAPFSSPSPTPAAAAAAAAMLQQEEAEDAMMAGEPLPADAAHSDETRRAFLDAGIMLAVALARVDPITFLGFAAEGATASTIATLVGSGFIFVVQQVYLVQSAPELVQGL